MLKSGQWRRESAMGASSALWELERLHVLTDQCAEGFASGL
jgi:hypothetical protein